MWRIDSLHSFHVLLSMHHRLHYVHLWKKKHVPVSLWINIICIQSCATRRRNLEWFIIFSILWNVPKQLKQVYLHCCTSIGIFMFFIILCFETWQPLVSLHVTVYRSIRHACIHSFHAFRCTRTHALHKNFLRILTWMHMMVPIKVWHGCTFTHINTCNLWEIITLLKAEECVSAQHREAPHPPTDLQFGVMWFSPSSWAFSHFWIVVKRKTHYTYPKLQHTAKEMCDMWHSFLH